MKTDKMKFNYLVELVLLLIQEFRRIQKGIGHVTNK